MKIAFVSQPWNRMAPPVDLGSISLTIYGVARHLAKENEVIVYSRKDPDQPAFETAEGIHYRRFRFRPDSLMLRLLKKYPGMHNHQRPFYANSWYYHYYITKVALDLRKRKIDVVHLYNLTHFIPVVRNYNPTIKIVLESTCEWLTQIDPQIVRPRLEQADLVLGVSDFVMNQVKERFPELAPICRTGYCGIDQAHFSPRNGGASGPAGRPRRLLYVGRISPEKGLHDLLMAFRIINQRFPGTQLKLIGPYGAPPKDFLLDVSVDHKVLELAPYFNGNYLERLQAMVPPELRPQVHFAGPVPHRDLVAHYREADVFVFPSLIESAGIPPIEAMATGVPVVSTFAGGVPEYVKDGETGILVERADVDALAAAVIKLLGNDDLRATMGRAGRDRVIQNFDSEIIAGKLLAHYAALLA